MTQTITIPDADDRLKIAVNKKAGKHDSVDVTSDQNFAIVFMALAPAVTQGDYPAIKAGIEAVAGIQSIGLLVDGQVPTIPGDMTAAIKVDAQLRISDVPIPE